METKQIIQDFEYMRNLVELNVLSEISLKGPLNDSEFNRMMKLKKEVGL